MTPLRLPYLPPAVEFSRAPRRYLVNVQSYSVTAVPMRALKQTNVRAPFIRYGGASSKTAATSVFTPVFIVGSATGRNRLE